jgi:hypothetical protein
MARHGDPTTHRVRYGQCERPVSAPDDGRSALVSGSPHRTSLLPLACLQSRRWSANGQSWSGLGESGCLVCRGGVAVFGGEAVVLVAAHAAGPLARMRVTSRALSRESSRKSCADSVPASCLNRSRQWRCCSSMRLSCESSGCPCSVWENALQRSHSLSRPAQTSPRLRSRYGSGARSALPILTPHRWPARRPGTLSGKGVSSGAFNLS